PLGEWLGPRELADLFAERPGVRENQLRVEPEDHTTWEPFGIRIAAYVVESRNSRNAAEDRLVWPPCPTKDVADREGDGHDDAGEHAERNDADEGRDRQRELGAPQAVKSQRARDVGQRDRRGDDD